MGSSTQPPRASRFDRWAAPAAIVALASPCLLLGYLPMTDLPQHAAVISILQHLGDPGYGFDAWYERALDRTLYLLPYGLTIALSQIVPPEIALRTLVFLSVIAYPLGVFVLLRATGRPGTLALLTLPLMYNRTFFWGFVSFNLGLGMALLAIAMLERSSRAPRRDLALMALCCAIVVTHIYAIAIVIGYVVLRGIVGDRRALLGRLPALSPLAVGAVVWFWLGHGVEGRGAIAFRPLGARLALFGDSVIGGYPNPSDEVLLVSMLAACAFFIARSFPWNRVRWRAAGRCERVFSLYVALNVLLYFALPTHLRSGHFINFRHALLAVAFLPLLSQPPRSERSRRAAVWLLAGLTVLSFAVHVPQLVRFDREAEPFDRVIARLPDAPKVFFLNWDQEGRVTETHAYHHFHGYIQARRGGLISFSFAELFWNIPVRVRDAAGVPRPPEKAEWHPRSYDYDDFGFFYDFVLVRNRPGGPGVGSLAKFPYERIYSDPPWELYEHRSRVDSN